VGISYVQGTVRGPGGTEATVEFMIDSGAVYTLLPAPIWSAIGLAPKREMQFTLADGTHVTRKISECIVSLPQGEQHSPVILGEPGDDQALLGAVTLEELGLFFDPFRRTVQPMHILRL
jgi:predicted aspartyl protease